MNRLEEMGQTLSCRRKDKEFNLQETRPRFDSVSASKHTREDVFQYMIVGVSFTLFFLLADCVQSFMTDFSVVMVPSSVIFTFTVETNPLKSWARA